MAISIVGVTDTPNGSAATTHDITLPAGIAAGDRILIYPSTQSSTSDGAPTAPDFTQRWSLGHASSFRPLITSLHKLADGDESSTTVTLTWGVSCDAALVCVVLRGVDQTTPFDATQTGPTNGGNNPDPAAITTGTDGAWVVVIVAGNRSPSLPTPTISSGYSTAVTQVPDERGLIVTYREVATAGAEDPGAWSWSTVDNHTTVTDAVRPAAAVTATPERAELGLTAATPTAVLSIQPERAVLSLVARTPTVVAAVGPTGPAFADGGYTRPRIEVALNHATAASPTDYIWTDLSARLESEDSDLTISHARGRADEAAETEPSQLGPVVLDNSDGWLTPEFAMSPYWPHIDVGLPLRYWEDGTTSALVLPGLPGAYAFSPDHADFDITGDLDARVRVEPNAWSLGATLVNGVHSIVHPQRLASKWLDAGPDRSWTWGIWDVGWPRASWSADGSATARGSGFPRVVAALRPVWLGWTFDVDDGAGGNVHTFYRWDGPGDPPDDITTWTVVAVDVNAGTTSIHASAAPLELGSRNLGADATFAGRIEAFQLRDGINGTLAANPDFTGLEPGTTSFVDSVGKAWQLAGAAQISRRRLRFCGEATSIKPFWPYGDHQPDTPLDGVQPTEARVAITASGVLERLTRGQDPLRSTLARRVVSVDSVLAYWPCEDGRQAAQFGPGIPGVAAMVTTGLDMAADDSLPASAPLPKVPAGETATWAAAVPTGPPDSWAVEMVLYIETPETHPSTTRVMSFTTAGTIARWTVRLSSTTLTVTAYDAGANVVDIHATGIGGSEFGQWLILRLEAAQDGADIDWSWTIVGIDTGTAGGVGDTITGETLGRVTGIDITMVGPPDGMSFGHLIVHDGALAVGWLAGADTAWAGESAAHRFWRLCAEEGVPAEIIGDPNAILGRGDLAASQAMGPQGLKTLAELLFECVAVDLAVLIEGKGIPGLIFRCRHTLEDQDPQLTLDAGTNDIADLAPTRDNQAVINTIEVTSTGGASAVAVDEASVAKHGRYSDSAEIAGVGGLDIQDDIVVAQDGLLAAINSQNIQQAGWRLNLGTAEGMRYSTLVIDLGTAPHLIEAWLATVLGDRVTLVGLPVQHPTDTVELLLQHISETVTPTAWVVEVTFTPGEPWLLGELVE